MELLALVIKGWTAIEKHDFRQAFAEGASRRGGVGAPPRLRSLIIPAAGEGT